MLTKVMKWLSITALVVGLLLRSSTAYQIALEFVVCVSALLVIVQAWNDRRYFWLPAFTAIAVLFNPFLPVALSPKKFLWLDSISVATFLVSLALLKSKPLLSMPSITNRTPGSESL